MISANQTAPEFGTERPKVSVIMAIRDEEKYGPIAIQSILDQTFTDFEFIIIDDASTDSTPQMLRDFAKRDKRIHVLTNEENLSVPHSANRGLELARGEYIARMDSDDYSYPHRFADQVTFLDANPDYIIVGGGLEYIDVNGAVFRRYDRGSKWWEFEWVSVFRPPLAQPCAMFRTEAVTKHNLFYDNEFDRAEDFEYWQRILRYGKGRELPGAYIQYRFHDRNVSRVYSEEQRDSARRAGKKNAALQFPEIPAEDINAVFNFLYSAGVDPTLRQTLNTIERMQSAYAGRNNLSAKQHHDVQHKTAKLLINTALRNGLHKNFATVPDVIALIARYFPDYCAEAVAIANRRVQRAIAA